MIEAWSEPIRVPCVRLLQSGMQETHASVVELGGMAGPVLTALISKMYGKQQEIPSALILPLFKAADEYQVGGLLEHLLYVTKASS